MATLNYSGPSKLLPPPPLVALATWVFPGAGYWLIGEHKRALTVSICILALFIAGLLIGGMRVVDPPARYFGNPTDTLLQKPWFIPQMLAGPIAFATGEYAKSNPSFITSHARMNEIGTLYTAVAGMLNLLAIIDSTHRAAEAPKGRAA